MTLFYYTGGGRGGRGGGGFGGGDRRGGRDDSRGGGGGAGGGNQGKLEARAGDWDCSSYVLFVLQTVTLKIFSCFVMQSEVTPKPVIVTWHTEFS